MLHYGDFQLPGPIESSLVALGAKVRVGDGPDVNSGR